MHHMARAALTGVTVVTVVTVPLLGTVWSARHAATALTAAVHRELMFTEMLLGVMTAVLAVVLGWLTLTAALGAAGGIAQLVGRTRAGPGHGGGTHAVAAGRSRGGSAVAAAVTALVLLAAGTQAASASVGEAPRIVATATTTGAAAVTSATPAIATGAAARDVTAPVMAPDSSPSPVAEPEVVGGWTPRVSPVVPATAALVLGAATTATGDKASVGAAHVVVRGESLWSIAAAHLGPEASATEISTAWPRWWQANRDVIGDDPDVIQAGQQLHPPPETPTDPWRP